MNAKTPFFSFDLRQPVNQWLGIALVSLMCFWVVLFYLTHNAFAVGENLAPTVASQQSADAYK